jgi:hypothetical protein
MNDTIMAKEFTTAEDAEAFGQHLRDYGYQHTKGTPQLGQYSWGWVEEDGREFVRVLWNAWEAM